METKTARKWFAAGLIMETVWAILIAYFLNMISLFSILLIGLGYYAWTNKKQFHYSVYIAFSVIDIILEILEIIKYTVKITDPDIIPDTSFVKILVYVVLLLFIAIDVGMIIMAINIKESIRKQEANEELTSLNNTSVIIQ